MHYVSDFSALRPQKDTSILHSASWALKKIPLESRSANWLSRLRTSRIPEDGMLLKGMFLRQKDYLNIFSGLGWCYAITLLANLRPTKENIISLLLLKSRRVY